MISFLHKILLVLFCTSLFFNGLAQTCPANIDFELGDFTNWVGQVGSVSANAGTNTINWETGGIDLNQHIIIAPDNTDLDRYGKFPKKCPNGSNYSILLGDQDGGARAAGISYEFTIPANSTNFSVIFQYAVVLQNPGHSNEEQPRFRVNISDANGAQINCVNFDFTSSSSLPGFKASAIDPEILYKDWTPVSIDLRGYAGRTVKMEFIASDCTKGGHFGYAYIDVNSNCDGTLNKSFYCIGDTAVNLTAPYGFDTYTWYSDETYGTVIGNSQILQVQPIPPEGKVYPVIYTPYPGFGCLDTLFAVIASAGKPVSDAGPFTNTCNKKSVHIGSPPTPGYIYAWVPENLLENSNLSNPVVKAGLANPTAFIVKTTEYQTSCFSYDTVNVVPVILDTASISTGKNEYCIDEAVTVKLSIINASASVQWNLEGVPIAGATQHVFTPPGIGNYYASITGNGCTDKSRQFKISRLPSPIPDFKPGVETQCINTPVLFLNKSTISDSQTLSSMWTFSDGAVSKNKDVTKPFAFEGIYDIKLVVTSSLGCKDSITKSVGIVPNCNTFIPSAFTPNGDNINDRITPHLIGDKKLKRFTVYNRYGNIVFTTSTDGEAWDGIFKGKSLDRGAYPWILEYYDSYHHTITEKGTILLIR